MTQQGSYEKRRIYAGERYLRSEHLLQGGKFISVVWEIADIVYECKFKKMGAQKGDEAVTKGLGLEFREAPGYVFGLGSATNESLIKILTGEGHPSKWIGKKVRLCVRLIADRKTKTDIPAIRLWTDKPIKLGRIAEQMGRKVDDEWYAANAISGSVDAATSEPQASQPAAKQPASQHQPSPQPSESPPPAEPDGVGQIRPQVSALAELLKTANDHAMFSVLREQVKDVWSTLNKAEKELLVAVGDDAKHRCEPPLADQLSIRINSTSDVKLLAQVLNEVAGACAAKKISQHEADALTDVIRQKMRAAGVHVDSTLVASYMHRIDSTAPRAALLNAILDDIAADVAASNLSPEESLRLNELIETKMSSA